MQSLHNEAKTKWSSIFRRKLQVNFLNENCHIVIEIRPKWSSSMVHICVTRPQWVSYGVPSFLVTVPWDYGHNLTFTTRIWQYLNGLMILSGKSGGKKAYIVFICDFFIDYIILIKLLLVNSANYSNYTAHHLYGITRPNVNGSPLVIYNRDPATLWQHFMIDHHICPVPISRVSLSADLGSCPKSNMSYLCWSHSAVNCRCMQTTITN